MKNKMINFHLHYSWYWQTLVPKKPRYGNHYSKGWSSRWRKMGCPILSLIIFMHITVNATAQHCGPDTKFLPSVSFEGTVPTGMILQAGLFAELSAFSIQAGIKIAGEKTTQDKMSMEQFKLYPRLELAYRAAGNSEFGIHPFVGLSPRPDIGVMVNLSCGTYTAFRTRVAYDGKIFVGAGMLFLVHR